MTDGVAYNSKVRDYFALLKAGVMSLVIFTAIAGMILAPGHIHPFEAFVAILCIALGSGASGAVNMWYDRDIDVIMTRTAKRPIPQKRIHAEDALYLGVAFGFASVIIMFLAANFLSALILAIAILFYIFIYTAWLKRSTPQNIVIGGIAGAFPPMIGWTCVSNDISIEPIIMFLIIFLWTPPHFWALALYRSEDYAKANIPMLPNVSGDKVTKTQILLYTIALFITSMSPYFVGMCGKLYSAAALFLNLRFFWFSLQLFLAEDNKAAPKFFIYSILYLFMLFGVMIIDHYFRF